MSDHKTLSFHVSGMHCASCAANISRRLKKTSGVHDAAVNYGNAQATVTFDPTRVQEKHIDAVVSKLGYKAHIGIHDHGDLSEKERTGELKRLRLKLTIAIPLSALLLGTMLPIAPAWLTHPWVQWLLATPVQFWAGRQFFQSAWSALKARMANMDTLIALGTLVAYLASAASTIFAEQLARLGIEEMMYFETASTIITLVLLGKFLELRAKGQAATAIKRLLKLEAKTAHVFQDGAWHDVPIAAVKVGSRLLVKPGEKVPVDGIVLAGMSAIDESLVTGESLPVEKHPGDHVIGASLNMSGALEIEAQRVGQETMLAQIICLVEEAQGSRPPVQNLADTISAYFVPAVVGLAVLTFGLWFFFGPDPVLTRALVHMVAVLIIACPCALGLATPTSIMVGIGKGSETGILIKNADALEVGRRIHTVVFDKTGTLTDGKPRVQGMRIVGGMQPAAQRHVLGRVRAAEERSAHPLAQALVTFLQEKKISAVYTPQITDVPGKGIRAEDKDGVLVIGTEEFLRDSGMAIPEDLFPGDTERGSRVFVGEGNTACVSFTIADTIRPEARQVVHILNKHNIQTIMLTGDAEQPARAVQRELGLSDVIARVLPGEKEQHIRMLQQNGNGVAMVGDGVNDAPALAAADLGIAMGAGTDVAIATAGVVLLRNDLRLIPVAFALSRATMRNIWQNLGWAFGYNVVLIPVAMGALAPFWGITISPIFASAAMALSSVSVVLNALRLKRFKPTL